MGTIQSLTQYNWFVVVSAIIVAMLAFKFLSELFEWFVKRFGIETKAMREKLENEKLLKTTATNLAMLQAKHTTDEKTFEELKDSIRHISNLNTENDVKIKTLMFAQKELLAEKINEKYKYYLSINGVPEDEMEEFISLHDAYKGLGGNHTGDAKFEYCIKNLPVIPVSSKLINDDGTI